MSEIDNDIETEARRLATEARRPKRRVRPRLARALTRGEDLEVDTPNGPVMAWRLGVGPATLLLHGWEDDNSLWSPLIDACERLGRAVVAFDMPGHGWSPSEAHGLEPAGEAALAVARALGPIDFVVGHSFGCAASIYALANGLAAPRVVLIGSPTPRTQLKDRWSQDWVEDQIADGEDPEVAERASQILRDEMAAGVSQMREAEAQIDAMTAQALVIHSLDDAECPVGNAYALAERWPGAELMLTDELGHRLIAQDRAVIEKVVDFVEGL